VSPAKTGAPTEMPFGLWAQMSCGKHVLSEHPQVLTLRDVAMATNFGTRFAITGFVGTSVV